MTYISDGSMHTGPTVESKWPQEGAKGARVKRGRSWVIGSLWVLDFSRTSAKRACGVPSDHNVCVASSTRWRPPDSFSSASSTRCMERHREGGHQPRSRCSSRNRHTIGGEPIVLRAVQIRSAPLRSTGYLPAIPCRGFSAQAGTFRMVQSGVCSDTYICMAGRYGTTPQS